MAAAALKRSKHSAWWRAYLRELRPKVAHPLYRSMMRIPKELPQLTVKVASTQTELEQAYKLLHDAYVELGYMKPHPSGMRVSVFNLLPHTTTLVALIAGKVIGTVSIIRANELGLPSDIFFDAKGFHKTGSQIAEVTGLAVAKGYRGHGKILFPLLKALYEYSVRNLKVDVIQMACVPRHEDFYRALFYFDPIQDKAMPNPLANGALTTGLYVNLKEAKVLLRRASLNRPSESNLFHYFAESKLDGINLPLRDSSGVLNPVLTAEMAKYLFNDRYDLISHLSEHETQVIRDIYRGTAIAKLLKEPMSHPIRIDKRKAQRFLVNCPAILEDDDGDHSVDLQDVSLSGFRMTTKYPLRLNNSYEFRVQVNPTQTIPITAVPVWNRQRREWGFRILTAPSSWTHFLNFLFEQVSDPKIRAA